MNRRETIDKQVAAAPESAKGILKRAYLGDGPRSNAIKAMCLSCVGFEREQITKCTGFSCPLWAYRPFQKCLQKSDA